MASIRKRPDGRWQAQVARKGIRRAKIFETKRQAQDWANREEHLILDGQNNPSKALLRDVLERYAREVSTTKRGMVWEVRRLEAMQRDPIASKQIAQITTEDAAGWRDRRLAKVSDGTVLREISLLSAVFHHARKEWKLVKSSPLTDMRKPSQPQPRDRLPTDFELEALAIAAGDDLTVKTARAFHAFRFACETGMRAGEIMGLTWGDISLTERVAHLPRTKNGQSRDVPLSGAAVTLLDELPESDPVFDLTSKSLDALWRRLRERAGVEGLTFHDSRAYAATQLSRKVDVLTLARILGHRDIKMLMIYYRESAADIAKKLD